MAIVPPCCSRTGYGSTLAPRPAKPDSASSAATAQALLVTADMPRDDPRVVTPTSGRFGELDVLVTTGVGGARSAVETKRLDIARRQPAPVVLFSAGGHCAGRAELGSRRVVDTGSSPASPAIHESRAPHQGRVGCGAARIVNTVPRLRERRDRRRRAVPGVHRRRWPQGQGPRSGREMIRPRTFEAREMLLRLSRGCSRSPEHRLPAAEHALAQGSPDRRRARTDQFVLDSIRQNSSGPEGGRR